MSYDHTNSESESGDSMSQSNSGEASPSRLGNSKPTSTTSDTRHNCSYCGTSFLRSETRNMPFCSRRCQQIDLGKWLTEGYGIPYEGDSNAQRFECNEPADDPDED